MLNLQVRIWMCVCVCVCVSVCHKLRSNQDLPIFWVLTGSDLSPSSALDRGAVGEGESMRWSGL